MTDFRLAVQEAVLAALKAAPLPGDVPVYQNVPDNRQPPVVVIGDISLTAAGGKGGGLYEARVEIISLIRAAGREFLTPLMTAVQDRLEDQPLAWAGVEISSPVFESSDDELLPDGKSYLGTQLFSLFVQPAD